MYQELDSYVSYMTFWRVWKVWYENVFLRFVLHGNTVNCFLVMSSVIAYFPISYYGYNIILFFIAVHFWAPTFKWGISIANIADFAKPPEKLSYPQQIGTCLCPKLAAMHIHTVLMFYIMFLIVFCFFVCFFPSWHPFLCFFQRSPLLESFGLATVL